MRVIIAGGTGLIGRFLTDSLAADGHEVVILSRGPARVRALPAGVLVEHWNGRTVEGWAHWVNSAGAVVNLAGTNLASGRWTAARKQLIRDSRLHAGRALVQAIEGAVHKPRVLIQSSGVGYYGFHGEELVQEEDPAGTDYLARFAVDWEASTAAAEALGVRRVVIRSGAVLTTQGGALPKMMLPFKFFAGGPVGSGKQGFSWIHVGDEIGAIRFLIDSDSAHGPFNLVSPQPTTNAEFGRVLARVMKRPFFMPVPAFMLRLVLGELSSVLLEGQRAVPKRLGELGFTFRFPDAESALTDLLSRDRED